MILLSFCSFPWWLSWLLPFLLGLALGWALWSKYKSMVADLESQVNSLNGKINDLEGDINGHLSTIAELEGDVATLKGKLRETELSLEECRKGKKGSSLASSAAIASAAAPKKSSGSGTTNLYAGLKKDNLQIIEGIGPKMEEVLKENGIDSWGILSGKSASDLRNMLDKYGEKYKIIDVTTWQQQAKLAHDGEFDGLIYLQKNIDGGSANTLSTSDSKLEKYLIKKGVIKRFKQDDLKAIEGIGPKIAGLLKDAGINTWKALSESTSEQIKEILDKAGSRYKLADPTTWPKQASLAHEGKWDELREYQDFLQGGKES